MDKVKEFLGYFFSGFFGMMLVILGVLGVIFGVGGIVHFIQGSPVPWYEIAAPFVTACVVGIFYAASETDY